MSRDRLTKLQTEVLELIYKTQQTDNISRIQRSFNAIFIPNR